MRHSTSRIAAARTRAARLLHVAAILALITTGMPASAAAQTARTLVAVLAHPDDEGPITPLLAKYAREGVRVYLIIVSDGGQGTGAGGGTIARPASTPQGEALVHMRGEEARCAAQALGVEAPILLGFPDGKLGDYIGDRTLLFRATARLAEELRRLAPDVLVTWGPDGGVGHPDHRIVSTLVTQLVRAGAPGAPERLYYMYLPAEGIRAMNPQRGVPPMVIPQRKYFTVSVPFTPADLEAARRSMICHRSQFTPEVVERVIPASAREWDGRIMLVPAFTGASSDDLFR